MFDSEQISHDQALAFPGSSSLARRYGTGQGAGIGVGLLKDDLAAKFFGA